MVYHSEALDGVARKKFEDNRSQAPDETVGKRFDDDNNNHYMRDVLNSPEARRTLLQWAADHKEVFTYLVEFAESRIQDADVFNEKFDPQKKGTMSDEERDEYTINPIYEPARYALLIAEKLDSTSRKVQRLLARTELSFAKAPADYWSAHKRVSRVLELFVADEKLNKDEVFFCRTLRSRIAVKWAEHEHKAGAAKDVKTLERMQEAIRDLVICGQSLDLERVGE